MRMMAAAVALVVSGTGLAARAEAPPAATAAQAPAPASPAPPDPFLAQTITLAPPIGLAGIALATQNPWPAVAIPASFGLGHLYVGEPVRGLLVTGAGPLATGGGYLGGALLGYGLSYLAFPGDFNPKNEMPPIGTIMVTGLLATVGMFAGLAWTAAWALEDVGRLAREKSRPAPGPFASPLPDDDSGLLNAPAAP